MVLLLLIPVLITAACTQGGDLKAGFAPPPDTAVARIAIFPTSARITTQESIQFTYIGLTEGGDTIPTTVADWEATGGTITSDGMFSSRTAGDYRVTAKGRGNGWGPGGRNRADTSVVTVTIPAPTLTGVSLSPPAVSLQPGEVQQFATTGLFSDGGTSPVSVSYSATGGTITSGGQYTAGPTLGNFRVIATEPTSGLADTAGITVTAAPPPALTAVVLTPPSVSLQTGGTQQFAASGRYADGSTGAVSVVFSATGGTISQAGLYSAGGTPGSYRVIAVQQGGTLADTSTVTVTAAPPTMTAVVLSPASTTLQAGTTRQFSVLAQYSDGSSGPVSVVYSATGGTIASGGLYSAGATTGTFRVIATQQGGTLADTSSVTITPIPTLTAVVLTPTGVTLQSGATRQFSVVGQFSDGSTGPVAVTYSATGGSISSGGLYTAGGTPGSFRVIAVQQGGSLADTSTVTIPSPPTLTQVVLSPASATVQTGGSQPFSVVGQYSDGSTGAVAVTYSATGGTISSGGLYTAGSTAGSFRVIAVQQGGTLADTSAVTLVAPPPPGAGADPTLLPVASGQAPNVSAYTALGVASQPAGFRFADPVTGAMHTKLSSSSVPASNPKAFNDYSEAGPYISRPWGGGNRYTITFLGDFIGRWMVDYEYGVGVIGGSYRQPRVGGGDLTFSFSNVASTPQIAYGFAGSSLQRLNTATNTLANTGNFPHQLPGGTNEWLQQDKNDIWFVWMNSGSLYAWNSQTNVQLTRAFSGLDEPHLELDGRYVLAVTGGGTVWDLQTNTVQSVSPPAGRSFGNNYTFGHASAGRERFTAIDWFSGGGNPTWFYDPRNNANTLVTDMGGYPMANHRAGRWIQENLADLDEQWYLISVFEASGRIPNGIAFIRGRPGGGYEERLVGHHYSRWRDVDDYRSQPHGTVSPDGRLVLYESTMQSTNRIDAFVIEVPSQ